MDGGAAALVPSLCSIGQFSCSAKVEGIQDVSVMNDRTQPCVFDISHPGQVFVYIHVDNFALLSLDLCRTQEVLKSLPSEFDAVGLRTHEANLEEAVQTTYGYMLNCRQHDTKTSPARWWRLYPGLGDLLKQKAVSGATVKQNLELCTLLSLCAVCDVATCSRCSRQLTSLFGRVIGAPLRCGTRCVSNSPF